MSTTKPVHFPKCNGKIHVVNQVSHPPCTRDAFLKYSNKHEPIVSGPDFSPEGIPKDECLPDLPEVIPPKITPQKRSIFMKHPKQSGPIETQDLGSDMEEDHVPEKDQVQSKQYSTLLDFLHFQQHDSDPDYPITPSDIQTSSFSTDCIDLTSIASEQSEQHTTTNGSTISASLANPNSIKQNILKNLPALPIPCKGHQNTKRRNLILSYSEILHPNKSVRYHGK